MKEDWEDAWENENEEQETEVAPRPLRRRRLQREERRGNLYLLTGLIIGLIFGLAYAWLISPVQYVDNSPSSLAAPYKDEYRRLIALSYAADKNLVRARERLALLESGDSVQVLASQAQRMLAENQPPQEARALAVLAADLGKPQGAPVEAYETPTTPQAVANNSTTEEPLPVEENTLEPTSTEEVSAAVQTPTLPPPTRTPTITNTPQPTFTPRPTITPLPVLDAPFKLVGKKEVCNGTVAPGLLQVYVSDTDDQPLPGIRIEVNWINGQDTFYTGLQPEIGSGYADFMMTTNTLYTVKVGDVSDAQNGLKANPTCSLRLDFVQQSQE